ncbi:hypothetical protein V4D30_00805 [Thermodesulfovibrio sp. 3907-1M]|uniref:Uncharacterized protein n=1 Tax=Thermodesulfovibrio autotrophicus TaxID=3118333 RepID=A0AAU8GWI0_9BACT
MKTQVTRISSLFAALFVSTLFGIGQGSNSYTDAHAEVNYRQFVINLINLTFLTIYFLSFFPFYSLCFTCSLNIRG